MKHTDGYGHLVENCLQSCHFVLDLGAHHARQGIVEGVSSAMIAAEKDIYTAFRLLPKIVDAAQRKRCSVSLELILVRFAILGLQVPAKYSAS
jgi:hypothetical protein